VQPGKKEVDAVDFTKADIGVEMPDGRFATLIPAGSLLPLEGTQHSHPSFRVVCN
jgi:hypothetical protein